MIATGQPELDIARIAQAMALYSTGDLEQTTILLSATLERDPEVKALAIVAAATYAHLQHFLTKPMRHCNPPNRGPIKTP